MAVPHQRILTIHKEPADKTHLYTVNNLDALDEAARLLQSAGGFKLYMYLAKNQHNHKFELSSAHFMNWSGMGSKAYTTAFNELEDKGYLILKDNSNPLNPVYVFYDKSKLEEKTDKTVSIEVPEEKVEEIKKVEDKINKNFVF